MFLKQLYIIASHVSGRASPPFSPQVSYSRTALLRHWRFDRVPQRYSRVDATAQCSCVFCDLTTYYKLKLVSIIMYQSTAK